jgi:hypothetical protein
MRPIEGSAPALVPHLRALADLGVAEAIIVADPIDERTIRRLGETVGAI